ncbi:MAG: HlyC/CorC family transporter [Pseudomonadales bacterium]|nr:HlyC/CorC family transporter [Pseudomonadales bacterium]
MITLLLIALILILLNALYVAAEFAVLGARVSRVQQLAVAGSRLAAGVLPVVANTARLDTYIAVCQIGITVTSLALGAFGQATFALQLADLLIERTTLETLGAHSVAALVVLVVLTSVQVVFGELLPKTVALQYPVRTAMITYIPMRWSHVVFAPFIGFLNGSGAFVLRRLGVVGERSHHHIHAPEEIEMLVRESRAGGHIEERQRVRLQRTLRLNRRSVRQIMVPRRRIAGIDLRGPLDGQLAQVIDSPFTRLVAHRGSLDDVAGYVHTKDVAAALAKGRIGGGLEALVRPLIVLSSRLTVDQVLGQLRNRRARLALIADPLGEIEGLVSIDDVMRELVGGLSDEFKRGAGPLAPRPIGPHAWEMPGRLPLDELTDWAREAGVEPVWAGSRAETLAGWLIERVGMLPAAGRRIVEGPLAFTIDRLHGVAIDTIRVERTPVPHGDRDG